MTVRAAAVAFALLLSSTMAAAAGGQLGSLCVERAEDGGSVNIYPVKLTIDKKLSLTLLGGAKSCLPLTAGGHNIELSWPVFDWKRPDHGLHGKAQDSEFSFAIVRSNEKTPLAICGNRSGSHVRWRAINGDVKSCFPS
jgi:hypothetical protein